VRYSCREFRINITRLQIINHYTAGHVAKWLHYTDVTTNTALCWPLKELDIRAAGPLSRFYNCSFKGKKKSFSSKVLEVHRVLVLDTLVELCIAARGGGDNVESKVPLHRALVYRKPSIVTRDMVSYA